MSAALECDLCEKLFKPAKGDVSLDVRMQSGDGSDSWSDIDFCTICSNKIKGVIGKALTDLCPK